MQYCVEFDQVISLGSWCGPATAIRRHTGIDRAYPLDWWVTHHATLIKLLKCGLATEDLFNPDQLTIPAGATVVHRRIGVEFHHAFQWEGREVVGGIGSQLPKVAEKFEFLRSRLNERVLRGATLFVRSDETTSDYPRDHFALRAHQVYEAIASNWPEADFHLLYLAQRPVFAVPEAAHERLLLASFHDSPGEDVWRAKQWEALLKGLAVRIKRSPSDAHENHSSNDGATSRSPA